MANLSSRPNRTDANATAGRLAPDANEDRDNINFVNGRATNIRGDVTELQKDVTDLKGRIGTAERRPMREGRPGDPGKDGAPGRDGKDGSELPNADGKHGKFLSVDGDDKPVWVPRPSSLPAAPASASFLLHPGGDEDAEYRTVAEVQSLLGTSGGGGSPGGGGGTSSLDYVLEHQVGQYRGPTISNLGVQMNSYSAIAGVLVPFVVTGPHGFDRLKVKVTNAATGNYGRSVGLKFAVFAPATVDGFGDRVADFGAIDNTSTGEKTLTINWTPDAPGRYWLYMAMGDSYLAGYEVPARSGSLSGTVKTSASDSNAEFGISGETYYVLSGSDPAGPTPTNLANNAIYTNTGGSIPVILLRRSA